MIWLKKVRKNVLPDKDYNIAVYLQDVLPKVNLDFFRKVYKVV